MNKLLSAETSSWYTSRTLWVSLIVFVAAGLRAFGVDVPVIEEGGATMGMILSAIMFALRLITKKPING